MTGHLGEALSALADGQLGPDEEGAALDHLSGCGSCASELASVTAVRSLVRALPPVEPRRPLVAVPAQPRRPSRLAGVLAAAAASVAMLLLSGVQLDAGSGPQVAQLVQVHTTSPVNLDPMSQVAPAALPVSFTE
ncbi:MAG TPA: zf-HC2 domain-containing protein [Acidimicrobiales bacterium]|nr:zf-HC2 domain-containing protein [Acidimicrobiales bacterium]